LFDFFKIYPPRAQRRANICLTCFAVPVGLGVKLAERSDSKFYDKGNVRSKQLLETFFSLSIALIQYMVRFIFY
jgi:hypothetical protein